MSARCCQAERGRKGPNLWGLSSLQTEGPDPEIARLQRRCRIAFAIIIVGCALAGTAIILIMLQHKLLKPSQPASSLPKCRICGQIAATASTTSRVPTPPETTEIIAPVAIAFPTAGPNIWATKPDSNPPSSLEVPMKRLLTAETRPRFSSGVSNCTNVWRTTTLTLSTTPEMNSMRNET